MKCRQINSSVEYERFTEAEPLLYTSIFLKHINLLAETNQQSLEMLIHTTDRNITSIICIQ